MTEKQIEKIRLSIKKHRAALTAEKRLYGGFHDGAGRRYYIADLYMRIADYKGAITYKKWFDKNFPDDIGGPLLSLNWAIAYFELGKIAETKIYTIDTAFQNIYLHGLLINREVSQIDMYERGYDILNFAKSMIEDCKKVTTQPYLDWLTNFMDTEEYKEPINKFIALSKLLKDENNQKKRSELIDHIYELMEINKKR
ncbi:MAG: hypothetical protein WAP53_03390 [Dysgonamonadaceae bacterium]|jgi:hypothetical protein|nr:hypothetical protein [Bacteroidales bacterium]HZH71176.1 hypothetical protein [Mariniphaga sp.]